MIKLYNIKNQPITDFFEYHVRSLLEQKVQVLQIDAINMARFDRGSNSSEAPETSQNQIMIPRGQSQLEEKDSESVPV